MELKRFPNTSVIPVMQLIQKHKLYFTGLLNKFNVLFLPDIRRAIVADADSVLVDTIKNRINPERTFVSFAGSHVDLNIPDRRKIFNDWAISLENINEIDSNFPRDSCRYVQGCHFYVNCEKFPYDLLYRALPFLGYRHGQNTILRAGDQGFWNLLVNWSGLPSSACELIPAMKASVKDQSESQTNEWNSLEWLESRRTKEFSFMHYVGAGRRWRNRDHAHPLPLLWASKRYYKISGNSFLKDEWNRSLKFLARRLRYHT